MENNNDITYFGKTNFRGQEHIFGIKRDDRRRHMYIIGKTGMGKTTLLENMIISDIQHGHGLAVVDPHGDLAEDILNFIPSNRTNDVVYFNPADMDYPIAFNVMEHVDPRYRHLVASGLIGVFKKIWADSWGPRLEYLLRNAILALLEYPDSTLLGVTRMLVDDEYRKKVVNKISDPVVKAFWTDEFTKYSKQFMVEAISPIQNKVGQFLSSALVRNIVSQPHSSIDMRDIMDNQKIFIVNLSKGRIGEDYSALLGAMLITKIQLAAMGRVDTPESERKDFYLYVDEFQNFATESFAGILSEARKYRLNLIVAHQYIGQLEETVSDAIFGNVGTIIAFRVGAADAEVLEKEFEPIFTMNDLVNLAKYDMYLKLMIDGVSGDAFSATSLPPIEVESKSDPEKIIRVSRERYTKKREEVEDKVARWSGFIKDEESGEYRKEETAAENGKNSKEKTDNREMWDAVCVACGTNIKVPFQPDPARPTYCKDCLLKVRNKLIPEVTMPSRQTVRPEVSAEIPASALRTEAEMSAAPAKVSAAHEGEIVSSPKIVPESGTHMVIKREVKEEEKTETSILKREVRETVVPQIKKFSYDPQKMIEFYEKKMAMEKEKRNKEKVSPIKRTAEEELKEAETPVLSASKAQPSKLREAPPAGSIKSPLPPRPAKQKGAAAQKEAPVASAAPHVSTESKKDMKKEIRPGEIIRFDN
jgi:CxxC-x17-CxxC domain-containing protein